MVKSWCSFAGYRLRFHAGLVHKQHKVDSLRRDPACSFKPDNDSWSKLLKSLFKHVRLFHPLSSDGSRKGRVGGREDEIKESRVECSLKGNGSPCPFADFTDSLVDSRDFPRRAAEPGRTAPKSRRTGKRTPRSALCIDLDRDKVREGWS